MNLTVPILDERWSPILVSAILRAVSYRGHVALRQTEIGQEQPPSQSVAVGFPVNATVHKQSFRRRVPSRATTCLVIASKALPLELSLEISLCSVHQRRVGLELLILS